MVFHQIFLSKNVMDGIIFKWVIMIFVLMLVIIFNLGGVNQYTIRRDELTTLGHIGALAKNSDGYSIATTIESLSIYSSDHSPLYYAIANMWGYFVDFNYFAIRMLSVWFGIIAVAGTYWIGQHLVSASAGLFSAILLGTNVVFYANFHEMREWSMMLMLCVLTLAIYFHIADQQKPIKPFKFFLLFSGVVLSLYTSYLSIFMLAAIGLHHLLFVPKNKKWWQISITVIVGGLTFVPWLPIVFNGVTMLQETPDIDEKVITNAQLLATLPIFFGNGLPIVLGGGVGLGLVASVMGWKKSRYILLILIVITASFLFTNEILSFIKRLRYLVIWLFSFSLFMGAGLGLLTRKKITCFIPTILIGLWVTSGIGFAQTDQFNAYLSKDRSVRYPEYNGLVPLLQQQTEKRDLLILAQYEASALNQSKQGLLSIQDYYLSPLKLTITNFPQYSQWAGSGIDADSVEYAMGLVPGRDEFWLSYHNTDVTSDIMRFREQVEQDFHICRMSRYGQKSILIHYVVNNSNTSCNVISQLRKYLDSVKDLL